MPPKNRFTIDAPAAILPDPGRVHRPCKCAPCRRHRTERFNDGRHQDYPTSSTSIIPALRLIVAGEAAPAAKLAFPPRRTIMPAVSSSPTRRSVLAGSAVVGAVSLLPAHLTPAAAASDTPPGQPSNQGNSSMDSEVDNAIRPFQFHAPEEALADLRRRIAATHWPDRETVADPSQGVQLVTMEELARYWGTDYDWRKVEARLNALPQFVTEIDGLDIHFIHVPSKHDNALPLIVTHGWPGSTSSS
jgi:hypothetical protein